MLRVKKFQESSAFQIKKSLWIRWHLEDGLSTDEILAWLHKHAKQGDVWAQFDLGYLHSKGQWVLQDYVQAYAWFDTAAVHGDQEAKELIKLLSEDMAPSQLAEARKLSCKYQDACDHPCDTEKKSSESFNVLERGGAILWFHEAAAQGNAEAQCKLGEMYCRGEGGVYRNYSKAEHWLRKAAEQGSTEAQVILNSMEGNSEEVPETDAETIHWFHKAAEQGDVKAQVGLGVIYNQGRGVSQDHVQAAHWYRKAADRGDSWAQNQLGLMHYGGEGIAQDYDEALHWLQKAAEQGQALAQVTLGYMHYAGQGVSQDFAQSAHWYRKSAEQGNVWAQTQLGLMYHEGKGVAQDYDEALYWLRKAAEQGWGLSTI